jgi:glycosyltransferase involved in cell wall biosynthesis
MKKGVSVIICCYNSASRLKSTLYHIAKQQLVLDSGYELIIVDNASHDDTQQVALAEWDKLSVPHIPLKIVTEPVPGLSNARKKGMAEATYDYLIFCDDDNWLESDYLSFVFRFFEQHQSVAILGGWATPVIEDKVIPPVWFNKFYGNYATGPQSAGVNINMGAVYGAGMAIRKSVVQSSAYRKMPDILSDRQGKNLTAGGDSELCFKVRLLGYQIAYSDQLKLKHYLPGERLNWDYLKKLNKGFAHSFVPLDLYLWALNNDQKPLPKFYWIRRFLYYSGICVKYWPGQYMIYKNNTGTVEEINHITWIEIAKDYLKYNKKTKKWYADIVSNI